MAAGDINDAASQIPGIALADDSGDPTDLGAGYALLKFKNGLPVWLPNGGAVRTALARGATSQLSTLTEEASPLDADLFLMERASDGALRKVQAQNLPGGGAPAGGLYDAYLCYQDQKAQNTAGGTFTQGDWRTRDLNTEQADTATIGSVAANRVTLPAASYVCRIVAPCFACGNQQARLQNITAGTTLILGTVDYVDNAGNGNGGVSVIAGKFTLAAESALEVQHYCSATRNTDGFGVAANLATEVYTIAEFWRLAT